MAPSPAVGDRLWATTTFRRRPGVRRTSRAVCMVVVSVLWLGACRPVPGPVDPGFSGMAYVVPTGSIADHRNEVPVTLVDQHGTVVGTDYISAGTSHAVKPLEGSSDDLVSLPWDGTTTALADRSSFWVLPSFVELKDSTVTVGGAKTLLGFSGLRYHQQTAAGFDDVLTPGHDGIALSNRRFLACTSNSWSMGNQYFTTDLVEAGLHRRDRAMIEKGMVGLDWGVRTPLGADGVHRLYRSCDGTTLADPGGTHHTTQWAEALGRGIYLLAASEYAGEYRAQIDTYILRLEEIATRLTDPANAAYWRSRWAFDSSGSPFTHKLYMRASVLGLASTLTDDTGDSDRWAADAALIAREAIDVQRPDGVNPERGGHDVTYQMYGTWLATVYHSTLGPDDPMQQPSRTMIDRSFGWIGGRVDPVTGQIDITGSTRVCNPIDGSSPYDAAITVRTHLYWGLTQPGRSDLVDRAILIEAGHRSPGNPCP